MPVDDTPAGVKFANHDSGLLHGANIMRMKGRCSRYTAVLKDCSITKQLERKV